MARGKKKETLTPEDRLQAALVPESEQPYKVPGNWCWVSLQTIDQYRASSTDPSKYAGIICIELAIENSGTAVDEDVEVELRFNNEMLLPVDKFPEIQDEYAIKYLLDKCDLEDLLSIPPTAQYKAYEDSQKLGSHIGTSPNIRPFDPFMGRNYQDDYREDIADIYCYEIFAENDQYIVKVKFDYIKHHTVIAFPTPIFLQQIPTEIEYTITSQNSPDILSGKLLVRTIEKED